MSKSAVETDTDVVDVMFRAVKAGDDKGVVEAWFPGLPGTSAYDMTVYSHVGQHGSGDPTYMRLKTRPATPAEYGGLKRELESIGYVLRVVRRASVHHARQRRAALTGVRGGKRRGAKRSGGMKPFHALKELMR